MSNPFLQRPRIAAALHFSSSEPWFIAVMVQTRGLSKKANFAAVGRAH
jgi:hypothetical protein